jgi:hypothetical protein
MKLSLPRVPSNVGIKTGIKESTIMRYGVLTVVLVNEDCGLLGYDTACTCSADI